MGFAQKIFWFYKLYSKNINLKKNKIINYKEVPNSNWPLFRFYKSDEINYSYLIILNYTEDLKNKNKLTNKFNIKFNDYIIIENSADCYLLNLNNGIFKYNNSNVNFC